jgi:hypothetical protein
VNLIWNTYYSQGSLPGFQLEGSFWWKTHLKLLDKYKGMSRCLIGDGKSALFWTDLWSDTCMHKKFPHLVTFAKKTSHSINEFVQTKFLEDLFNLPLSTMAYNEFLELEVLCETTRSLNKDGSKDSWLYIWNSDEFSSKKGLQGSDWLATLCSSLLLGLELIMLGQTQVLLLAVAFG